MRPAVTAATLAAGLALLCAGCGGGGGDGATSGPQTPPTQPPAPPPPPPPPPSGIPYPAGLSSHTLTVGGVSRGFLVHVPPALTQARALIVVLHGGTGSALSSSRLGVQPLSVFRTIADREGLVVVYPDGLSNRWNDCRGDTTQNGEADDVGFLDALLSRLEGELRINSTRVFMTGTSNGGLMTFRYAIERSNRVAGVAISAANLPANPWPGPCSGPPSRVVPILMQHGTADPLMPYDGGPVGVGTGGLVIGAEATRDRWLIYNGLTSVTPQTETVEIDPNDGGSAVLARYVGIAPLYWSRLNGGGHASSSRVALVSEPAFGPQNRDVEFAELAWELFRTQLPLA